MTRRVMADLRPIKTPADLLAEVLACIEPAGRGEFNDLISDVYHSTILLYHGRWPDYLECDTHYHDIAHAAEVFLAMGRLISGALVEGRKFSARKIALGLTAAILHDTGYIRTADEQESKGAGFRGEHERRGTDFLRRNGKRLSLTTEEISECCAMIQCTILTGDIIAIPFQSESTARLGRMLATADLLAQLSSSTYLEKLSDLYAEDQDDSRPHYADLEDCFRKAIAFDKIARERLQSILPEADDYLKAHFDARWKHPANLYTLAIEKQNNHLAEVVGQNGFDPRHHLRRWGSLDQLRQIFGLRGGAVKPSY